MRKSLPSKKLSTASLCALLLAPVALTSVQGCTDLSEEPTSAITPNNFYRTQDEVLGGVASVYAGLRPTLWEYYNLSQVTTDENIVPTRGQDWFDNGRWLEMHRQTWTPNSPLALEDINGAYNNLFAGVARANVVLNAMESVTVPGQDTIQAELRTLRAFYYYMLMDMFGGVPIVTNTEIAERPRETRDSVFRFIEAELTESRAALPERRPAAEYGRVTKGAVDAILANMYLNAQVFTGEVTASGLQPGTARWEDAIAAADRVLNSGVYSLAANWRSNFDPNNESSPENIFVVRHVAQDGLGLNFVMRATHYNQLDPSPWNGFATLAETYRAFDAADRRREIFLVGPQVNLITGEPINDRTGNRLVYTVEIQDPTQATEGEGARIVKFAPDPARVGGDNGNDYPYFRLAEMYLIKAEALNELGRTAEAVALVNTLRARVFTPPQPLAAGAFTQASFRDQILKERLFELTAEAKRRQDLIRFGRFTMPWSFKEQREPYRILMPIPQTQLQTNPLLTQNPGY
jgi:hypothetical protein